MPAPAPKGMVGVGGGTLLAPTQRTALAPPVTHTYINACPHAYHTFPRGAISSGSDVATGCKARLPTRSQPPHPPTPTRYNGLLSQHGLDAAPHLSHTPCNTVFVGHAKHQSPGTRQHARGRHSEGGFVTSFTANPLQRPRNIGFNGAELHRMRWGLPPAADGLRAGANVCSFCACAPYCRTDESKLCTT